MEKPIKSILKKRPVESLTPVSNISEPILKKSKEVHGSESSVKSAAKVSSKHEKEKSSDMSEKKKKKKKRDSEIEFTEEDLELMEAVEAEESDVEEEEFNIDSMFDTIKVKKEEKKIKEEEERRRQSEEAAVLRKLKEKQERKLKELESKGRVANRVKDPDSPQPLRFDPELNMNVYHIDSLRLDQGKDTPLCPFDCDCCY